MRAQKQKGASNCSDLRTAQGSCCSGLMSSAEKACTAQSGQGENEKGIVLFTMS